MLTVGLLFCLLVFPSERISGVDQYLEILVSRTLTLYPVEERVVDREVLGRRTYWIALRNYESVKIPVAELEIRTLYKPDLIRFHPSPSKMIQDQACFVFKWRFEQIGLTWKEECGLWLIIEEDVPFSFGADVTRIISPSIIVNEKNHLTCTVKVLPSGTLGGLWVAMRTPESDAVTPKVTVTEPNPSRVMLIDDYWGWEWGWWTPNIAKNLPYTFKIELDALNRVYPSSVMYKPWVLAKQVEKLSRRGQTYSERGVSVQDDLLGMITWRVDGMHCWFWFFEDAREACFESVSTWPAGSNSAHNRLDTDRLTSHRFESSRTTERLSRALLDMHIRPIFDVTKISQMRVLEDEDMG